MRGCLDTTLAALRDAVADVQQPLWQLPAVVLMLSLLAALLLAPLLQRAYVRRVQRLMAFRELQPPPPAWWERQARRLGPGGAAEATPVGTLAAAMHQRGRRIRHASLAGWAVLVLGSVALLPLYQGLDTMSQALLVLGVALLGAQPLLVNLRPDGSKWMLLAGVSAMALLILWLEEDLDADALLGAAILVLVPHLVGVQRNLRAMVVPLTLAITGLVTGVVLALVALAPGECLKADAAPVDAGLAWLASVLALSLGALVFALWATARALDGLARLVSRGWMSDLSVVAASGVLLITGLLALSTDAPGVTPVTRVAAWGGWFAAVLLTYVLVLWRLPRPAGGRRLLMLRVFSRDRQAERLLDTLQARWQLAGPVLEIGGPDLVRLNMDFREVVAFVNFRLHELFQPSAVPAEVLAGSLDLDLDREGRFRVNEVFCFDTSWKHLVDQLMGLADVVLLDLRGFNDQRGGTSHEVRRLAARGLLPRVVALHDDQTQWPWFERCVDDARGPAGQALALKVDARDPAALATCLQRLVALADAAPA